MLFCAFNANAEEVTTVSADKYDFLFTAKDLELYGLKLDLSGNSEKTTLKTYDNGSKMLKYEYDVLGKPEFTEMFFAVYVDYDKSELKAKSTYILNISSIIEAAEKIGDKFEETKPIVELGDQTKYFIREHNGQLNGFLYAVRKDRTCYTILTSGLYNSSGELFTDEIQMRIQKLIAKQK